MNPRVSLTSIPADRWERAFGRRPVVEDGPSGVTGCGLPLALPDGVPDGDVETDKRGGIERTARKLQHVAARGGVTLSHSDAVDRVRAARTRGDRIRGEGNR